MLAAHLALATLTAAPEEVSIATAPIVAAEGMLSAEQKAVAAVVPQIPNPVAMDRGSADAQPVGLALTPPRGGEIPGFRYFVAGLADATTTASPAVSSSRESIEPASADPLDDLATPATANVEANPSASLDDIDLAAPHSFPDPLEPINRIFYAISQPIDRFALRPAAMVYKTVVPRPARDGARNAISNFHEPIVFLNDLVQLRPDRAVRTLGRFLVNSVLGLGGLFDIAKREPFHLAHHENGFGDTLGYFGIGPLLYVYLPVLGPTTLRDSAGEYGDSYFLDRNLHKLIHPNGRSNYFRTQPKLGKSGTIITVIDGLDQRAESDDDLKTITRGSVDPYAALRANYLQDRAAEIAELRARDGEAPANKAFDDPLVDPGVAPTAPAPETKALPVP